MNVKVGDFGLAALLVTEKEMEVKRRTTMCGTPNYLAPEILEKGKGHDEKVYLWAIGVIAYTLAVGKAPFHASTKEEIYKKLKSGTYAWPELSGTTNQSSDLRNLVSSLLVPEDQRPIPDQIVSQPFFKIAFVPSSIPSSARERPPKWPEVCIPSAEVVRRGYSDTWYTICKESGVGEYLEGKSFKLNGGKRVKSIVHDMAQEVALGRVPTMPLPKDLVYISTVSDWNVSSSSSGTEASQGEKWLPSRQLKEISHNEVATTRPYVGQPQQAARDAQLMPPPPRMTKFTGSTRRAARTISEETAKATDPFRIASDEANPALKVARARPSAPTATSALRDLNTSTSSTYQTARLQAAHEATDEKPARTGTIKRSADASLARRPRTAKAREQSSSTEAPGPMATLDELRQVSPFKKITKKRSEPEVIEILSDPDPEVKLVEPILSLPPPPRMAKRLPTPRIPSLETNAIPGSDPSTVLQRLRTLRDTMAAALSNNTHTRHAPIETDDLPFVTRWVDYSRKHGVGYVMSDGTVGCIVNASRQRREPGGVTHCLVRDGIKWLTSVGDHFERIEEVPLEVLEDCGDQGIKREVYKGLGSVKEGPLKDEADRRRVLGILWAKFGRYMCLSLDGEDMETSKPTDTFVRFYQRIGHVGIWGFTNGCLQVSFPDHTKLVVSATGTHVAAMTITPEAAAYLATNGELLGHHINSREYFADSTVALLHEGGRLRARTVKANSISTKATFVHDVVAQWVKNGGLGRLDDDEAAGGEKLYWEGLMANDGARKMDRITVGRYGGDRENKLG